MPTAVSVGGGSHIPRRRGEYPDAGGAGYGSPGTEEDAPLQEDRPEGGAARAGPVDEFGFTTLRNPTAAVKGTAGGVTQQQSQRFSKTALPNKDNQGTSSSLAPTTNSVAVKRPGANSGARPSSSSKHRSTHRATSAFADEERYLTVTPSFSWKHFLLAASAGVFAASAFYVIRNWDNLVNTRQIYYESYLGGRNALADFRQFDMLRKAEVAPRYTLLEKIDDRRGWVLQMDVPGFAKDEIDLHSSGPFMSIRGTHSCLTAWNGLQDPTCVERHVFDEIRFPDEADMDTAHAEIENGVLKVFVKPILNYTPRGRVIRIVDQALGKVQEKAKGMGETVKERLGFGLHKAARPLAAEHIEIGRQYDDIWKFTAKESEEVIRQKVDSYIEWLRHAFHIPAELANDFLHRVHVKTDELIRIFRKGALTISDLRDRVYLAAEAVWPMMKDKKGRVGDLLRQNDARAADEIDGAGDRAMSQLYDAKESIDELADAAKTKLRSAGEAAFDSARAIQREIDELSAKNVQKLKDLGEAVKGAAKDKAREYAEKLKKGEEDAGLRAADVVEDAAARVAKARNFAEESLHHVSEKVEHSRNKAKEAANRVAHSAEEAGEQLIHRVEENVRAVSHRMNERAEVAEDRAREAAHIAEHRRQEGQTREPPRSFAEALKEKLWGRA